jgi:hypothetical protein
MIIDPPEAHKSREYWLKFLPQVSIQKNLPKDEKKEEESKIKEADQKLTVAWRYNDLVEEKMLAGKADPNSKDNAFHTFKFDSSKSMGDAASNQSSHTIPRQQNTIYL